MIVIVGLIFPRIMTTLSDSVARPFWRMQFAIESGSLNSVGALLQQNEDLKRNIDILKTQNVYTNFLEKQNIELKTMLGRASSTAYTLAAVLKKPPLSLYDEYVIDIGKNHGVSVGDRVYVSGDILIGEIRDALAETSRVILFSSPGQKYQVTIGDKNIQAQAVGRGGGQYVVYVPHNTEVYEGDLVFSPYAHDKPMGIVVSIKSDPAMSFQSVFFAPPLNIYDIRWVLVVKNKK